MTTGHTEKRTGRARRVREHARSRLRLSPAQRDRIERHAASVYPEECCGILIGRLLDDALTREVDDLLEADNEREDSRHNRYIISPRAVLDAQKRARERGLEIIGYYHSHPDHPAEPSDFDREHAWPGTSYLIVSVREGEPVEARSWQLTDERDAFVEELLVGAT